MFGPDQAPAPSRYRLDIELGLFDQDDPGAVDRARRSIETAIGRRVRAEQHRKSALSVTGHVRDLPDVADAAALARLIALVTWRAGGYRTIHVSILDVANGRRTSHLFERPLYEALCAGGVLDTAA